MFPSGWNCKALSLVLLAGLAAAQERHWAYEAPRAATPPPLEGSWPQSAIDRFVFAQIEHEGRYPAPEADHRTLVRRLFFDLTGLPPSPAEVEAFVVDPSQQSYRRLVERLLASEPFAERMAVHWLDLVRYADSTGVHADNPWHASPYRDWVIEAFHRNKPFDEFTREQLAGDLLDNPRQDQRVASAYNRLNLITREGGSQPKEFIARYMADRVRNLSTVWLGATVGCAECHDHKFDPISAGDFYRLGAFFADIKQVGVYSQAAVGDYYFAPYQSVATPEQQQQLADFDRRIAEVETELAGPRDQLVGAQTAWEEQMRQRSHALPQLSHWSALGPFQGDSLHAVHEKEFGPEHGVDRWQSFEGSLQWVERPEWADGKIHKLQGDRSAYYLFRTLEVDWPQPVTLLFGSDDSIRVWVDGKEVLNNEVTRGVARDQERVVVDLAEGSHELLVKICNGAGGFGFYFNLQHEQVPQEVLEQLAIDAGQRDAQGAAAVSHYFRSVTPLLTAQRDQLRDLKAERASFTDGFARVLATVATKPMATRVLPRGNWLDESGDVVQPGVPAAFGEMSTEGDRATRLDLAEWLLSPGNPLVARVFVNRLWRLFMGRGIVSSLDDFGTQGARPTHPELLDWLALRFVDSGWDVKAMVELMVTSATYRQSSDCDALTAERDPYNQWFSRQARYRHDAEVVRDNALAVSGLLVETVGGRSVRPYQPAGFYRHLNFPKRTYQTDTGENLWRRSVYTHWQRQYLHPTLAAFDAPSREECTVERARSNTPLQALVLLNDPIFTEAARALAVRMMGESGESVDDRIKCAFALVLNREPTADEARVLRDQYDRLLAQYQLDEAAAHALLAIGEYPVTDAVPAVELAATTGLARVMLCLHETLTRY